LCGVVTWLRSILHSLLLFAQVYHYEADSLSKNVLAFNCFQSLCVHLSGLRQHLHQNCFQLCVSAKKIIGMEHKITLIEANVPGSRTKLSEKMVIPTGYGNLCFCIRLIKLCWYCYEKWTCRYFELLKWWRSFERN
jgi:hypothetical protein